MPYRLGYPVQNLAVVEFEHDIYAQPAEHLLYNLYEFDLAQQRTAADDIHVALVKLPVTSFLRSVGTPYGLHLIAFERKHYFALMLNHVTGERHRKVVAQSLFAYLCGKSCRRTCGLGAYRRSEIARIENLEKQFVALLSVLAHKGGEILHCGSFERRESVQTENALYGIENVGAAHHLHRREIARTFGYGWFLHCHEIYSMSFLYLTRPAVSSPRARLRSSYSLYPPSKNTTRPSPSNERICVAIRSRNQRS